MHRFFCHSRMVKGDTILLTPDQLHHVKDVLRLRIGDAVVICDEQRNEYECSLAAVAPAGIVSISVRRRAEDREHPVFLTVACALPKKSFDDCIDKLTQLGVYRIIPLETQRVIVRLDTSRKVLRQKRWERIALHASQQAQRTTVPLIDTPKAMNEVLSETNHYDCKLIPTLMGNRVTIRQVFLKRAHVERILLFVGPEGDFTPEEIDAAKKQGCVPVSLGDLVLRVDTAAIAVASYIRFTHLV